MIMEPKTMAEKVKKYSLNKHMALITMVIQWQHHRQVQVRVG